MKPLSLKNCALAIFSPSEYSSTPSVEENDIRHCSLYSSLKLNIRSWRSRITQQIPILKNGGSNPFERAKKVTVPLRCRCYFLVLIKRRDSNKEGAYEVCGRKQSGGLFSPTWQRAKRGDRRGSVGQNPFERAKGKSVHESGRIFLCIIHLQERIFNE